MSTAFNFVANRKWKPDRIAARMAAARDRGAGAYIHEWRFTHDASATIDSVLEPIVHWCKETLSVTRRPWGIEHFDLVIAVRRSDGEPESLSLKNQEPAALYGRESLVGHLRRFLDTGPDGHIAHISIALFSWGDAAHAAMATETSA